MLRHGGALLVLAGVNDFGAHHFDPAQRSDPAAALHGAPQNAGARVLLAHQPRSAPDASDAGFDLQMSGHTHGGQFRPWNCLVRYFPTIHGRPASPERTSGSTSAGAPATGARQIVLACRLKSPDYDWCPRRGKAPVHRPNAAAVCGSAGCASQRIKRLGLPPASAKGCASLSPRPGRRALISPEDCRARATFLKCRFCQYTSPCSVKTGAEKTMPFFNVQMAERVGFEPTCRNYPTIRFRVGAVMTTSVPLRLT